MERRNFLKTAAMGLTMAGLGGKADASPFSVSTGTSNKAKFTMNYAPTLGQFKEHAGNDPIDNLKFIADQGFTAAYDLGMMARPAAEQEKIAREAARLGITLGQFSFKTAGKASFVLNDPSVREMMKEKMLQGIETSKRTGIKQGLVVPGNMDAKLHPEYQMANVVDNLRYCCDLIEDAGLQIVLEPLNTLVNHPGVFLQRMPQAYLICTAVNRESCKIVPDLYHQQITEGNLVPNLEMCWKYIGTLHTGDNPGRKEPTSGEINYKFIFSWLKKKGYQGLICLEHGQTKKGKEGELALIEAYRQCDPD